MIVVITLVVIAILGGGGYLLYKYVLTKDLFPDEKVKGSKKKASKDKDVSLNSGADQEGKKKKKKKKKGGDSSKASKVSQDVELKNAFDQEDPQDRVVVGDPLPNNNIGSASSLPPIERRF